MGLKGMAVLISKDSPTSLLNAAYEGLEFEKGALFTAAKRPDPGREEEWLENGDWLALAKDVGAEKIFFVDREPVAVFAEFKSSDSDSLRKFYNRIWCMARPQFLFLARPGELTVCDLGKPPIKGGGRLEDAGRLLERAEKIADVQQRLAAFHRERIETGAIFGEEHFGQGLTRADRALIRDLKEVRRVLDALPLRGGVALSPERKTELLHSLIGRAIFIRYLEDREIITGDYFEKVIELNAREVAREKEWRKLLENPLPRPDVNPEMQSLFFPRVLCNKDFTYALFDQLAHDFNGDIFPVENDEQRSLLQHHLTTLRDFLLGVRSGEEELFFYAYDFQVIPIELISSIYEEFYNERVGDERNQGSHYTPPALVEFVLANTLKPDVLAKKPRVLDPACGSGIFLVEAFRRIVRHLCVEIGTERPSRQELRRILHDQIAGIDINEEAVRVAAFSLYLAFLHYQIPREILPDPRENLSNKPESLRKIRLPHLKHVSAAEKAQRQQEKPGVDFFDILLAASAFDPVMEKSAAEVNRRFGTGCADVIVGNPPWGDPDPKTAIEEQAIADLRQWCNFQTGRPVGDNERSQAFIHLTLALLREGGRAGLLASSGILFKHHENSRAFRQVWLNAVQLRQIVNFAHVRHVFFSGTDRKTKGISPFISVVFDKSPLSAIPNTRFEYWSVKRTAVVEKVKAVVMTRGDMHYLNQRDCLMHEKLWKIYWWGGHRDEALVRYLETYPSLVSLSKQIPGTKVIPGRGFQKGNQANPAGWLAKYEELPANALTRYGPLRTSAFRPTPLHVEHWGLEDVFHGRRLLVGRGIKKGGVLTARFETQKYAFRNSVHGVRFKGFQPWQEAAITAFFWSSLARYYFFAGAGSWGLWHDEIHLEDVEQAPIRFPEDAKSRNKIVDVVSELQQLPEPTGASESRKRKSKSNQMELGITGASRMDQERTEKRRIELERQLDKAVFDLYELDAAERDLVSEMCLVGLDLYDRSYQSDAVKEVVEPPRNYGILADVVQAENGLAAYLRTFLEGWNPQIAEEGEFAWRIIQPSSKAPLLAVVFETRSTDGSETDFNTGDARAWERLLAKLHKHARMPMVSSRIYLDTFFRIVTEHEILIVKRNERRFWTKTAAREDVEATMLKAITEQENRQSK
jgi:hypothetical protein